MKVFLTGASRGIGKAIFQNLKGYEVFAPTRQEMDLTKLDIGQLEFDILINCAGVNYPIPIEKLSDENLRETFEVNVFSPIKLIQSAVPYMKKRKWGRIVNISSILGITARKYQTPYVASKHALIGVTKALALELAPYNILVNSVCPGFTETDLLIRNNATKLKSLRESIPMGRFAQPIEIANLVKFLISKENTYITGESIVIDGGFTKW